MGESSPIRAAIAVMVTAVLVFLSAMVIVPPVSMSLFPFAVGAIEMSPFLVLANLLWCLAVNRLFHDRRRLRYTSIVLLLIASVVAVLPLTRFTRVAAAASAQLGTEAAAPQFSLVTAVRGLPTSGDVVERTIPYLASDGTWLYMRLYTESSRSTKPVVVVIYGGAWRNGDAAQGENVSRALAARGFAVAAIDYRHAPKFQFPSQLDDVRRSLALLRDSAAAWGLDVHHLALLGRSSGGQLAELAAYTDSSRNGGPVRAVVALYAPYDLAEGYRDPPSPDPIDVRSVLRGFLGGTPADRPDAYREASPSTYVRRGLPPTLLIYGGRDHIVRPEFNRRAASDLRAAHVPVIAVELPWAEHAFDLAPTGLGSQLAFNVIVDFLEWSGVRQRR